MKPFFLLLFCGISLFVKAASLPYAANVVGDVSTVMDNKEEGREPKSTAKYQKSKPKNPATDEYEKLKRQKTTYLILTIVFGFFALLSWIPVVVELAITGFVNLIGTQPGWRNGAQTRFLLFGILTLVFLVLCIVFLILLRKTSKKLKALKKN